jgi:hypothetical protein
LIILEQLKGEVAGIHHWSNCRVHREVFYEKCENERLPKVGLYVWDTNKRRERVKIKVGKKVIFLI